MVHIARVAEFGYIGWRINVVLKIDEKARHFGRAFCCFDLSTNA